VVTGKERKRLINCLSMATDANKEMGGEKMQRADFVVKFWVGKFQSAYRPHSGGLVSLPETDFWKRDVGLSGGDLQLKRLIKEGKKTARVWSLVDVVTAQWGFGSSQGGGRKVKKKETSKPVSRKKKRGVLKTLAKQG